MCNDRNEQGPIESGFFDGTVASICLIFFPAGFKGNLSITSGHMFMFSWGLKQMEGRRMSCDRVDLSH